MIFDVHVKTKDAHDMIVRVSAPNRKHAIVLAKRSLAGHRVLVDRALLAERVPYVRRRVVSQCIQAAKPRASGGGRPAAPRLRLTLECGHRPWRLATARSATSSPSGDVKITDRRFISCVPCTLALRPIRPLNQEEE